MVFKHTSIKIDSVFDKKMKFRVIDPRPKQEAEIAGPAQSVLFNRTIRKIGMV